MIKGLAEAIPEEFVHTLAILLKLFSLINRFDQQSVAIFLPFLLPNTNTMPKGRC